MCTSVCTYTVLIRQCVPIQFLSVSVYLYSSYPVFCLLVHLPVFFSYFAVLTMDFKKPGLATTAWHLRDYPVGLRVIPVLKIGHFTRLYRLPPTDFLVNGIVLLDYSSILCISTRKSPRWRHQASRLGVLPPDLGGGGGECLWRH